MASILNQSPIREREAEFFDDYWNNIKATVISSSLVPIPGVKSLVGKRVLICSCGSGVEPVQAAKAGGVVYTFDISNIAVEKASVLSAYNRVKVNAQVMSFEALDYESDYFDV